MWQLCAVGCRYTGVYADRAVDGRFNHYTANSTSGTLGCYSTEKQAAMSYDHFCIYQVIC